MTCIKVINLESLRSKKKSDSSLSEHNSSSEKKMILQQSQDDESKVTSKTPEVVMPPPSGEPLLKEDPKNEIEISPMTQQLVKSVTCDIDSGDVETKNPAPEVNEHLRPFVTSAPYASGKYVFFVEMSLRIYR